MRRLQRRRDELEEAVRTRVYAVADPNDAQDPVYLHGFQVALEAAVDFAFAAARGEEELPSVPPALLIQARLASFSGVSLDTVLRRYLAGYTVLHSFFVDEANDALEGPLLKRLLNSHATAFDRLLAAVSEEYRREEPRQPLGLAERRAEQVRRLLDGEIVETKVLDYDFARYHVGMVYLNAGPSSGAMKGLARAMDARLLCVGSNSRATWAWLGTRRPLDIADLCEYAKTQWRDNFHLALGESCSGLAGWRLTHQQAKAAARVLLRRPEPVVRYREVALLASTLRDEVLSASLRVLYLDLVSQNGTDGGVGVETLRAFFRAGQNISSAAAELGLNRNTVTERLKTIEVRLGRPIQSCSADLEVAIELAFLDGPAPLSGPGSTLDLPVPGGAE